MKIQTAIDVFRSFVGNDFLAETTQVDGKSIEDRQGAKRILAVSGSGERGHTKVLRR